MVILCTQVSSAVRTDYRSRPPHARAAHLLIPGLIGLLAPAVPLRSVNELPSAGVHRRAARSRLGPRVRSRPPDGVVYGHDHLRVHRWGFRAGMPCPERPVPALADVGPGDDARGRPDGPG